MKHAWQWIVLVVGLLGIAGGIWWQRSPAPLPYVSQYPEDVTLYRATLSDTPHPLIDSLMALWQKGAEPGPVTASRGGTLLPPASAPLESSLADNLDFAALRPRRGHLPDALLYLMGGEFSRALQVSDSFLSAFVPAIAPYSPQMLQLWEDEAQLTVRYEGLDEREKPTPRGTTLGQYIPADAVYAFLGEDLQGSYDRTLQQLQATDPALAETLTGVIRAVTAQYFGEDFSLKRDFLSATTGPYAVMLTLDPVSRSPIWTLLTGYTGTTESLTAPLEQLQAVLYPAVRTVELPDGDTRQELYAEPVERLTQAMYADVPYTIVQGSEARVSLAFSLQDNLLILSSRTEGLHRVLDAAAEEASRLTSVALERTQQGYLQLDGAAELSHHLFGQESLPLALQWLLTHGESLQWTTDGSVTTLTMPRRTAPLPEIAEATDTTKAAPNTPPVAPTEENTPENMLGEDTSPAPTTAAGK
ncbi:hypothetical protein H6771_01495 [Candidatus Peribacteria bacterium]|nr:hypothetical protein [Candidatus Peribacteria bacterium]